MSMTLACGFPGRSPLSAPQISAHFKDALEEVRSRTSTVFAEVSSRLEVRVTSRIFPHVCNRRAWVRTRCARQLC